MFKMIFLGPERRNTVTQINQSGVDVKTLVYAFSEESFCGEVKMSLRDTSNKRKLVKRNYTIRFVEAREKTER